ncbi:sensor histidine kinase [Williamsia maris]|nr:HAMP domain-containing sensor histidine kinase [Williamsia maris]
MRRRILLSMIAMVVGIGLLLGLPLMFTAWWWVDDLAHQDLDQRLKRVSSELIDQEVAGREGPASIDSAPFRLLLPANGRLELQYPAAPGETDRTEIGSPIGDSTVSESVSLGDAGAITMEIPLSQVRSNQWTAVGVVALVLTMSVAAGTAVAAFTAKRLADPLEELAERASSMAQGDFHSAWKAHGIVELDRVSSALEVANREIALRLEREGEIVGEVSHQLRSRLTAIQLRLDELSLHDDANVVTEAEAAHEQVERLNRELDELISVSRDSAVVPKGPIPVQSAIDPLVRDFTDSFAQEGRSLAVTYAGDTTAWSTPSRLREAVSVLIDNALRHGDGDTLVDVAELSGAGMLRVSVSDEGSGVPDELVPHIFRRGYSTGGSSGVGLSLARALIEADGGRLDLAARRPATFTIVVPTGESGPLSGPRERPVGAAREPR